MKRGPIILIALVLPLAIIGLAAKRLRNEKASATGHVDATPVERAPDVRAPDSVRVRVQVLNGTRTRGLARRATVLLRDRGFDVVENGNEKGDTDTTIVYDLTGHPDWAQRVAKLLPPARVVTRADTSRYLDVVVVLGTAWRPPAESLHP
jgi:hypothetical protein